MFSAVFRPVLQLMPVRFVALVIVLAFLGQTLRSAAQPKDPGAEVRKFAPQLFEAAQIYKQQTGKFPRNLTELGALLSPELRAAVPGQPEFRDPDAPEIQLRRKSPLGDRTPWLRLKLKDGSDQWINVGCDGSVYLSKLYWESECVDRLPLRFTLPSELRNDNRPISARVPPRRQDCTSSQLDLTSFATAVPTLPWFTRWQWEEPGRPKLFPGGDSVAALSAIASNGVFTVSNRLFDVRALIHLDGATGPSNYWYRGFPTATSNITVQASTPKLHILAGTYLQAPPETKILSLWLNYNDGQTAELPIRYGVEVADARFPDTTRSSLVFPFKPVPKLPYTEGGASPSLFYFVLENPHPAKSIASLRLVSAQTTSHPYILAITLE